jgi:hypothetical protein
MAKPVDIEDKRVQWILRAVRTHPDCTQGELWDLELNARFTGYTGKGSFNYSYIERTTVKLRAEGYIVRGARYRLKITGKGEGSILPFRG